MCGIALAQDEQRVKQMMQTTLHRGRDEHRWEKMGPVWIGLNRLSIFGVHDIDAIQPLRTGDSITAFNGELYNVRRLGDESEIRTIENLMRRWPRNFEKFLDGYYGIVRYCSGSNTVTVSRDFIGVIPLYYQTKPWFGIASERKALVKSKEVMPGETITFNAVNGKVLKRRRYEPISLHMESMNIEHLKWLFMRAVQRRLLHSERPISIALSGGLDSALVLHAARKYTRRIEAVTISFDDRSDELENAKRMCFDLGVEHKVVNVNLDWIDRLKDRMLYHLEDYEFNPIKYTGMVRNYLTALVSSGTVILCGEGADELGGGYPSHWGKRGLELEWKCYSTLRSMHAINLDRVNKGGMAHTKEFRVPFLDKSLVLYMMGCKKGRDKLYFRQLARMLDVPEYVIDRKKYSEEEYSIKRALEGWR